MAASRRWLALLVCVPLLTSCAALSSRVEPPMPMPNAVAALFVADGAGNYQMFSRALRKAVRSDELPIDVITCEWSHGIYRSLADHLDYPHAIREGDKLAETIRVYRAEHPQRAVHLAGHSAGAAVVLAALERLPPHFVDDVVLIAPSVCSEYDVGPALQSINGKMHVFHSPHDCFFLGAVTGLLGSSDQHWCDTAGRVGFRREFAGDGKLVQHGWQQADAALSNYGGHFGAYQREFLRQRVLPLLDGHQGLKRKRRAFGCADENHGESGDFGK